MSVFNSEQIQSLFQALEAIARDAGDAILAVYNAPESVAVDHKADQSPITQADLAAHDILVAGLTPLLPGVPVLSEESHIPDYETRGQWHRYWLIDPLDGTKEFINRNGEFTVNIALIDEGAPVLGMVYVPVKNWLYYGANGHGSYRLRDGELATISTRKVDAALSQGEPITLVASRNHGADAVQSLMDKLSRATQRPVATDNMGSSLKLCLVADGSADLYPRLALTSEWDTAAAQAIVEAAGGAVVDTDFRVLRYNQKADILNPFFYVIGDIGFPWQRYL
ncbi:3'(2'),5'-bisphosphate nucleotidase CysQ [Simiduia agarivorans]|uniref:3'(2'),5'-bisphosphate nucleotidase CysQ n=1 Tax=Simiduia agarivorans (strain DSM 21679 / JCM 13881 / BCRC 17597 / SA1) TaxID=1117647 RepID=K4KNI3_SIMAS|nr:3'(2'),5'-bisphosphate nucleotidase CysQ [Simiduia agarivorans]AFU99790.1 thioredoxin [Simiduia agarivorans SA1 = DSM 21679]